MVLQDSSISFEEKVNLLYTFLEKANEEDKKRPLMDTDFYNKIQNYIIRSISDIEKGKPVQTRRK